MEIFSNVIFFLLMARQSGKWNGRKYVMKKMGISGPLNIIFKIRF